MQKMSQLYLLIVHDRKGLQNICLICLCFLDQKHYDSQAAHDEITNRYTTILKGINIFVGSHEACNRGQ